MKIENIPYICDYTNGRELPEINHVTSNVRDIGEGSLFVLTKKSDGRKRELPHFVNTPRAIVCEYDDAEGIDHPFVIAVENARCALSFACAAVYAPNLNRMKFLSITGTNGKTTTAYALYHILSYAGKKAAFIGNGLIEALGVKLSDTDYSMTTPDPELLYKHLGEFEKMQIEYVVIEASSHAIALSKLDPTHFLVGAFTNLSHEHMDFHRTVQHYLDTKLRLFRLCDAAIINADDRICRDALDRIRCKAVTVGALFDGDVKLHTIEDKGLSGISYIYKAKNCSFRVKTETAGIYNVYNTAIAATCASEIGIAPCVIKKALSTFKGMKGRYEIINGEIKVIIDYAHTPFAIKSFLSSVRKGVVGKGRLICVFGCGGERDSSKRPLIARAVEEYADTVIVTEDNSRNEDPEAIIKDIFEGFSKKEKVKQIPERACAIEFAILSAGENDTVALIGKGSENYNIDRHGFQPFNEREIIAKAFELRRKNQNENKA